MEDERLAAIQKAAVLLKEGNFSVAAPTAPSDPIGQLGQAINDLGKTLQQRFDRIEALNKISDDIHAGLLLEEILENIYNIFHSVIPYDRIGFALIEDSSEGQTLRACWAKTDYPEKQISLGYTLPLKDTSLSLLIESQTPRVINDLEMYLKEHPDSASTKLMLREGIRSNLTCPIISEEFAVGFLFFSSQKPDTYSEVHAQIYSQIANRVSAVVQKSRLYQNLLEANQMKDRLLGTVAHDLRNPIGNCIGFLTLFLEENLGPIDSQQRDIFSGLLKTMERANFLINDLLDFASIESGHLRIEKKRVPLKELLSECCAVNTIHASTRSIEIIKEWSEDLPEIEIDRNRMGQVLDNLIGNAIKHSPKEAKIWVSAYHSPTTVEIKVKDNGSGIKEEDLKRIFGEYEVASEDLDAEYKNYGLGLAICRRILNAHDGKIRVTSEPGQGSEFTVSLNLQ